MTDSSTIITQPTSTVDHLSKGQNTAEVIYNKPPDYECRSSESMKNGMSPSQIHQPQSTYNINSTSSLINSQSTLTQSTHQIESYISWSVLNTFCCCLCLGCVAWHYSSKTKTMKKIGRIQDALKASKKARNMNIITTMVGIILLIIDILYLIYYSDQIHSSKF